MTADPEQLEDADLTESTRPAWSRWFIAVAAALVLLLVGATVGLLITRASAEDEASAGAPSPVDVGFAQDMSVHHLQAVTMANWARDHSTDPEIRQLAFDIASTQTEQVGRMKGWLMLWDAPEQNPGAVMSWMNAADGHGHGMAGMGGMSAVPAAAAADGAVMPGMATNTDLSRLRSLSGTALDVDFLQLMLRHHQGGTEMARYAQAETATPAVRALATSMLVSQGAEITTMTQLLAARNASPLPAP